ncbi:hypothetical protein VNO80_06853 [Phaseolus coccineus]|uniref:Uncharacterized protein n=1 Tax=Phaseolus coccineus TaxID=3886 RepID=A0AAN9RHZ1_PHACN
MCLALSWEHAARTERSAEALQVDACTVDSSWCLHVSPSGSEARLSYNGRQRRRSCVLQATFGVPVVVLGAFLQNRGLDEGVTRQSSTFESSGRINTNGYF